MLRPTLAPARHRPADQRLAAGKHPANDCGGLLCSVLNLGHTACNDHRLGALVDGLARLGDGRIWAPGRDGFALVGDQQQVVGLGAEVGAFGKGVHQADDRGRRQRDSTRAGVDVGNGNAVKETTHG